ncbi:hypothetical protein S245_030290, partial [Arachis hypogaea]
ECLTWWHQACRVRFVFGEDILANSRVVASPTDILPTITEQRDDLQLPPAIPNQRRRAKRRARDDVRRPAWRVRNQRVRQAEGDGQRAE